MERAAGRRTEGVDPAEHVRQWQVGQVGADGLQPRHELLAVRGEQRVVRRQQVNVLHQRRPVPANRPARSRTALSRLGEQEPGVGDGGVPGVAAEAAAASAEHPEVWAQPAAAHQAAPERVEREGPPGARTQQALPRSVKRAQSAFPGQIFSNGFLMA